MNVQRTQKAICVLQYTLGVVILIEAILFVMPAAGAGFARTHMPQIIRLILGWGEIVGAILLLIPYTALRGAWLLLVLFLLAIAIHILHGQYNMGNVVVYAAAAWAVAASRS